MLHTAVYFLMANPKTSRMLKSLKVVQQIALEAHEGVAHELLATVTNMANAAKMGMDGLEAAERGPARASKGGRRRDRGQSNGALHVGQHAAA